MTPYARFVYRIFLILPFYLRAQLPPMHHYDAMDGLVNNVVYLLEQDSLGRIWMGTEGGVSVFDGAEFKNYTSSNGMASNTVVGFGPASSGGMYILHYSKGLDLIEDGLNH